LTGNSDLVGGGGPLSTFDDSLYKDGDKIKKFNYYFGRYLQRLAFAIINDRKKKGVTGQNAVNDVSHSSYDEVQGNNLRVTDEENDSLAMEDAIRSFTAKLDGKNKEVMELRMQGKSNKEIADILGYSNVRTVEFKVKKLGTMFRNEYKLA